MNLDPSYIEKDVFTHVNKMMEWGARSLQELPPEIRRSLKKRVQLLSDSFTSSRDTQVLSYFTTELDVAAYAMYFHAASFTRVQAALSYMDNASLNLPTQVSVLDVGCGSGAASQAFLNWLSKENKKRSIQLTLMDQSKMAVDFAKDYLANVSEFPIGIKSLVQDVEFSGEMKKSFDVYLFSNVINEMQSPEYLEGLIQGMKDSSVIVFVEPALQKSARSLMSFKERLARLGLQFLAPCTHNKPCPMMKSESDWCHFETGWEKGPFRASMDQSLGHRALGLKYSFLIAGKKKSLTKGKRIVSSKLKSKIKKVSCVHACTEKAIEHWYFDKKDPNFKTLKRGDILEGVLLEDFDQAKRFYPGEVSKFITKKK